MSNKFITGSVALLLMILPGAGYAEKGRMQKPESRHEMMQDREHRHEREEEYRWPRDEDRIYAWQLMSPDERQAHRQQRRSLKTRKEREACRKEHHERMKKRAGEAGVKLQELRN